MTENLKFNLPVIVSRSYADQPKYTVDTLKELFLKKTLEEEAKKKKKKYYVFKQEKPQYFSFLEDKETLNLHRKLKEIRKNARDKNSEKNFEARHLAFMNSKVDLVYESQRMLKEINRKKENILEEEEKSLNAFITENREISKDRKLISFLGKEKEIIRNKIETKGTLLESIKENLERDNENFNNYKFQIKEARRMDEEILNKKLKAKEEERERYEIKLLLQKKSLEDEAHKLLDQLSNCGQYAYFVHYVFGKVIPELREGVILTSKSVKKGEKETENLIDISDEWPYNELTDSLVKKYEFCLDEKQLNTDEIIKDTSKLEYKYKELEDLIIKYMEERDLEIEHMNSARKGYQVVIKELEEKLKGYEDHYKRLEEEKRRMLEEIEKARKSIPDVPKDAFYFIREINLFLDENPKKKFDNQLANEIAHDTIKQLIEIECEANSLIAKMTKQEAEDKELFYTFLDKKKEYNKLKKQENQRKKLENIQNYKKKQAAERFNKVIIKHRNDAPPYYLKKKERKVVVLETNENDKLNSVETLKY